MVKSLYFKEISHQNINSRNLLLVALCIWIAFYYLNSAGDFEQDFRQPSPARSSIDLEYLKFREFLLLYFFGLYFYEYLILRGYMPFMLTEAHLMVCLSLRKLKYLFDFEVMDTVIVKSASITKTDNFGILIFSTAITEK